MLGLCALHLLAHAIAEFHGVNEWAATMSFHNKQALYLLSHHNGRIQPSTKCAKIRRNFCATKQIYKGSFKYVHMYGYMNQQLPWTQLSLLQQLNCICDMLAKRAVALELIQGYHKPPTQLFPREDVALIVWGNKVTGDVSGPLRGSTPAKRLPKSIFSNERRTSGHLTNLKR
jgi:hypothetical protein